MVERSSSSAPAGADSSFSDTSSKWSVRLSRRSDRTDRSVTPHSQPCALKVPLRGALGLLSTGWSVRKRTGVADSVRTDRERTTWRGPVKERMLVRFASSCAPTGDEDEGANKNEQKVNYADMLPAGWVTPPLDTASFQHGGRRAAAALAPPALQARAPSHKRRESSSRVCPA